MGYTGTYYTFKVLHLNKGIIITKAKEPIMLLLIHTYINFVLNISVDVLCIQMIKCFTLFPY